MDLEVNGPGLALLGGDDSHRDLAPTGTGHALDGPRVRRPAAQLLPSGLQALGISRVGLRLIAGHRLYCGAEGTALLDVSHRSLVDQMRKPDFHDVLPGRGWRCVGLRG